MREAVFIRQNIRKWKEYEYVTDMAESQSPDVLADMYTDLTADLAFSQTHYPDSRITTYLNNLTLLLHTEMYRGRREKWSRVLTFWTREVPQAVYDSRRAMLSAAVVLLIFIGIGAWSVFGDDEMARVVLGDGYVDMTIENIRNGNPTDVYDGENEMAMTLWIMFNNLFVGVYTFCLGLFTPLGTAWSLMHNGVMVGVFISFFAQYGVFQESFLAVMQHGTLEISTIALEGGAGFVLGSGWLFPGTYSRMQSFLRGARRALKIAISVMPFTIVAAVFEGFLTRHTELPDALRWMVVLLSAAVILFYYVYLPIRVNRLNHEQAKETTE
ncbi:MAG: stage II sporulation protein M [Muribaculaceae bacterium]|nr:stage II sporulation protein M [Muribaculaceae bacterium]